MIDKRKIAAIIAVHYYIQPNNSHKVCWNQYSVGWMNKPRHNWIKT